MNIKETLPAPKRPSCIPDTAQWLAGEGAGSWFHIKQANKHFEITRYNPDGKVECTGIFQIKNMDTLDISLPYNIVHLSHCKKVSVEQGGVIILERLEPEQ
ncbi:MAG: hypothetical protein DYG98_05355 [Haliscomenobacteraceae bacterium CHB4]|nr:hypothetical protein [Saprospiraceae bacterium]MCE7922461.1 hypothetical protein [Haliscomenobacteraceae bacterium CHB4]